MMLRMISARVLRKGLTSVASSYLRIVSTYSISTLSGHSDALRDRSALFFGSICRAKGGDRSGCHYCRHLGGIRSRSTTPDFIQKQSRKVSWGTCREVGCSTTANYGWEGGGREYCSKHKRAGMECVVAKLCEHHEKCIRIAIYGLPGGEPTHCGKHKLEEMLNLKYKLCESPACKKYATFGLTVGEPIHCGEHKDKRMEVAKGHRCQALACQKHALFGLADEKRMYCKNHMKPGMYNLISKRCEEPGCDFFASFGYAGDRRKSFCGSHKLERMIYLNKRSSS